jgi:hypothetical protein
MDLARWADSGPRAWLTRPLWPAPQRRASQAWLGHPTGARHSVASAGRGHML